MKPVIGVTTTYLGEEFPGLKGREVRIIAVLRKELEPACDADAEGYFLTSDEEVARSGGVGELDRVAVALLRNDGAPSWVHSSARAIDLACFKGTGPGGGPLPPSPCAPRGAAHRGEAARGGPTCTQRPLEFSMATKTKKQTRDVRMAAKTTTEKRPGRVEGPSPAPKKARPAKASGAKTERCLAPPAEPAAPGAVPSVDVPGSARPVAPEPAPTPPANPTPEPKAEEATTESGGRGRFAGLTVAELQAKYLEAVGRPTQSSSKAYISWKVREAEKGRIPVGPRRTQVRDGGAGDMRILPLRLEAKVVDSMDEAWRSRGIRNRMDFFRRALGHYLEHLGAGEAAVLFATPSAPNATPSRLSGS